jgi:hypothetical protein
MPHKPLRMPLTCGVLSILLACQPSAVPSPVAEPYDLGEALTATAAGAPSRADCEALQPYFAKRRPSSVPTKLIAACLVYLCANTSACGAAPPPNPNPPTPGVGGNSGAGGSAPVAGAPSQAKCSLACANLAALGCPEDQSTCSQQCEILTHDDRFTFNVDCRINAKTKAAAQACGVGSCK